MQGLLQSVERVPEPPPGTCSPFPWLHPLNIGSARRPPRRGSVIVRYQAASLNCYRAKISCDARAPLAPSGPWTILALRLRKHYIPPLWDRVPYREEEKPLDAYAVSWKDLRRRRGLTVASFVGAVLSFLGTTSAPSMVGALSVPNVSARWCRNHELLLDVELQMPALQKRVLRLFDLLDECEREKVPTLRPRRWGLVPFCAALVSYCP